MPLPSRPRPSADSRKRVKCPDMAAWSVRRGGGVMIWGGGGGGGGEAGGSGEEEG